MSNSKVTKNEIDTTKKTLGDFVIAQRTLMGKFLVYTFKAI